MTNNRAKRRAALAVTGLNAACSYSAGDHEERLNCDEREDGDQYHDAAPQQQRASLAMTRHTEAAADTEQHKQQRQKHDRNRHKDHSSLGLPAPAVLQSMRESQRADQAHAAEGPGQGGRGDRKAPEGSGREGDAKDGQAEAQESELGLASRGLISLGEMLKRYAESFYLLGNLVERISLALEGPDNLIIRADDETKVRVLCKVLKEDHIPELSSVALTLV